MFTRRMDMFVGMALMTGKTQREIEIVKSFVVDKA
jgi:hypothetical protein